MTIQDLVNTLTDFKDEYKESKDREVRRMCGFVTNTIEILNSYARFFYFSKKQIEKSQEYYESALETLNKLLLDENGEEQVPPAGDMTIPNLPDPGLPSDDSDKQYDEHSGQTLEDVVNNLTDEDLTLDQIVLDPSLAPSSDGD